MDIFSYIEEVYAMDYVKYKDICIKDYEKLNSMKEFNPNFIFEINNKDYDLIRNYDFSKIDRINKRVNVVVKIKYYIKKFFKKINIQVNKSIITKNGYKK